MNDRDDDEEECSDCRGERDREVIEALGKVFEGMCPTACVRILAHFMGLMISSYWEDHKRQERILRRAGKHAGQTIWVLRDHDKAARLAVKH